MPLWIRQKAVPLHQVFHGIRFKVNKGWVKALTLFLYLYVTSSLIHKKKTHVTHPTKNHVSHCKYPILREDEYPLR